MPLFNLDVEKSSGGEFWTNRYVLSGASLGALSDAAVAIVAAEKAATLLRVMFVKYRLSDRVPDTDNYVVVPINQPGLRGTTTNAMLPLWMAGRVDFATNLGRPSRKYLRGVLLNSDLGDFGQLIPGAVTVLDTYGTAVLARAEFVDVDGQAFASRISSQYAAMRQLRRGSRRKATPIL